MTFFLKEKLLEYLLGIRGSILRDLRQDPSKVDLFDTNYLKKAMDKLILVRKCTTSWPLAMSSVQLVWILCKSLVIRL